MADLSAYINGSNGLHAVYYSNIINVSANQTHTITPAQDQYVMLYTTSSDPTLTSGGNTIHSAGDNNWLVAGNEPKASSLPALMFGRGESVSISNPFSFECFYALLEEE